MRSVRISLSILLLAAAVCACFTPSPTPPQPTTVPPEPTAPVETLPPTPPVLVERAPARGEEAPVDGTIRISFDQAMNRSTVEEAFSIEPAAAGSFAWPDPATLVFTPERPLQRATRYQVRVGGSAKSAQGLPLNREVDFSVATVGYLEVTQVIPEDGAQGIAADSSVTVMFNRPVVPLMAVSDPEADYPSPLRFDPPVEGTGEWLNTSIYVFTPSGGFTPGTRYQASVEAGLADTTGGVLEQDYTWTFSIEAPSVVETWPADVESDIGLEQAVRVTFSQPMDPDSVAGAFSLETIEGGAVAGTSTWSADSTELTFTPTQRLQLDTRYVAEVSRAALSARGGAPLREDYAWTFDTVRYPAVLGTSPGDGAVEVYPYSEFQIYFSAPMAVETLLPNVTILPAPTEVYTYWSRWDNSFSISWDSQPSTRYEIRMGADMADPYGNRVGRSQTVRFTTGELEPRARLEMPGSVGVYNAYTATIVYALARNVSQLDFQLARLSVDDFLQLTGYRSWEVWDSYAPSAGDIVRTWSLQPELERNANVYLRVPLVGSDGTGETDDEDARLAPGLYFLTLSAPETLAEGWSTERRILVVTRQHVTFKLTRSEALVWVTDLQSGAPLYNQALRVLSNDQDTLAGGSTGRDGVFQTDLSRRADVWEPHYAFVGQPGRDDFGLAMSSWYDGIGPWDYGMYAEYDPAPHRVYLYTDRPIYRTGQPVYFRGVLRSDDDARYRLAEARSIPVKVYDNEGNVVYEQSLPLSGFGTFAGQLTLDEAAGLGSYVIEARLSDEESFSISFSVAEYRRPEFQVQVETDADVYLHGDTLNATVQASYFFGAPVANAPINWVLLSQDYYFQPNFPGRWDWIESEDAWRYEEEYVPGYGRTIASGSSTTDGQGRFTFAIPADIAEFDTSQLFTVEATVTDVNDQTVSNRVEAVVHKGTFYVGLQPQAYVGREGAPSDVNVVTVDWEGQPVPEVPLQVRFARREWFNVQEEDEYGNLMWTWEYSDTVVYTQTLNTGADGRATATFTPTQAGSYVVRAEGMDEHENRVRSATWLWVSGSQYVSWRMENNDRIDLIADQDRYAPGDVARVMVPSPFQGEVTALFSVERGHVIDYWVQTLRSNSEIVQIPITEDMIPNAYVSVVLVKGVDEGNPLPAFRLGYAQFEVSTAERELQLTITPDRDAASGEHYAPRETVRYEIQATNASGAGVQAEIGLALVDLSVLTLAPPNVAPISSHFYGQRGLGVRTADTLVLAMDRINQHITEEVKGGGGGGPELRTGEFGFVRQDFPDTAYWNPSVVTDENGRATVEAPLSDQLTTWRLDARAITADTLVGQSTVDVISTKDLLLRPVTPRFFVVDDQADLAAVVHNNTPHDLQVEVWIEASGLTLQGQAHHNVTVPANDKVRVEWPVLASNAEFADVTFYAQGGGFSDATKPPAGLPPDQRLPIYRYSAPEVVGTAGQIDEPGSAVEAIVLPRNVDTSQGDLTVRLEPSLAAGMTEGLDWLEHFPYECTEQTVSRFLPNVLTYRALAQLGLEDPELEEQLQEQVSTGLQRLYSQQHFDGGWGWWVSSESHPLVTAYVLLGLVKAQEAGFTVEQRVVDDGIDYLQGTLRQSNRLNETWKANRRAFILYVLAEAGSNDVSAISSLYEDRALLDHYGRAYLALALGIVKPGDDRIDVLLSDLNNAAIVSATGTHWQESGRDWWNWNSDTRTTAIVLDAYARLDPQNRLASNAVRWLMVARSAGHWETTQETAWALIGLTDWMVATGELEADYSWGTTLNGRELGSGTVTEETLRQVQEFRSTVADLLQGQANRLEIARGAGDGRLYYTAHLRTYLPVEDVQALNRGIVVGRQYCRQLENGTCTPLNVEPGSGVGGVRVGDTVQVRLTLIAPNDLHFVVLEDPFPAGMEAIDTSLLTTSVVEEGPEMDRVDPEQAWDSWTWGWGWWWFGHSELRDEKVVLFADYLPAGTYEYTYSLHAGLAGIYHVMPAFANEMYFPEVFGRSDGTLFTIERGD